MSTRSKALPVIVLLCILTAGISAGAQDTANAPVTTVVLPGDGFVPGWTRSDSLLRFSEKNLYGYIDGGAELFLEFGFRQLLVQRYSAGGPELSLEVFVMENAAAALGIYLMRCGAETPIAGIGVRNSGDRYQFNIVSNNCYLLVNNYDGDSTLVPVMTGLARQQLQSIPAGARLSPFALLPQEGLVPGSERLIRGPYGLQPVFTFGEGDILRLSGKIFAVLGNYQCADTAVCTRIEVPYPDPATARHVFEDLAANLDPYLTILEQKAGSFSFRDFTGKFGSVAVKDARMTITVFLLRRPELE